MHAKYKPFIKIDYVDKKINAFFLSPISEGSEY